jgi:hypothetical protein
MSNDNDEIRKQANQVFNIAEKPIMEYVCAFLDEPCSVVFNDILPKKADPVILLPIIEYKQDKYLKFTLKTQLPNCEENRVSYINDIIKYKQVKESIGFLTYCIKSIYPSIVASGMINNKPMVNTFLELNENNWTFSPVFNHDLTIKKKILNDTLNQILHFKNNEHSASQKSLKEINDKLKDVQDKIEELNINYTPEIIEIEKNINNLYKSKPVLCILIEELTKDELPKN